MGKLIFILGGARSGKSLYAAKLAMGKVIKKVAFIATCQPLDKEMKERIRRHKEARPENWKTLEEDRDVASLLAKMDNSFDCIVVDCLTLLVSNLLLRGRNEDEILKKIGSMLANLRKKKAKAILVSNEVGLGIVPVSKLGRDFRDIAGKVNQLTAKEADEVFFMISGIPTRIKRRK
ncbi:MAG: bifunctional adenosylcobinamide kinase/adenosylcobinamide-phosphate guanylyltransferase [Candidatus Omnitrophica bacterium CG07_land_8_20_14_0_80_42_15]|uniref:Adenosylcobinamide kinase n=1 Tax=Candidatus Aquitaenariimonas noxiae TaxID=1974741 RepID=A0A2J0KYX9_9BACT|nr:MAG: bifunctional adenosylcobinamide kinase/adenosylcobinamide-phosphate guanylyltransferase [Candidatus Omnitrophica bacterium CG07_land_8_20_14_0_80_42_15]